MTTTLSPALAELVSRRDQLQREYTKALIANKNAHSREAQLEADYKREWASAYLTHRTSHPEGQRPMPETDARARADLDTDKLLLEMLSARHIRMASAEALSCWEKDLDFLTASAHTINRELKTLGG
jgi:hypothetical protein